MSLDGEKIVALAGDPTVLIPPRIVHSMKGFKGERLVFREKVDPGGEYKAL